MDRERASTTHGLPRFALGPVAGLAAVLATVLTALSGRYGYHRDELYFLAAGDHLAWGYTDQPPLTPFAARVATEVFGESPAALRVPATLALVATLFVVALIARELGGDRRVQVLAAGLAGVGGQPLAVGHMLSTATFDLLAWLAICWLLLRLLRTGDGRWWVPTGLCVGAGLLNKYLVALLVLVLLAAVLPMGARRLPRGPWLFAGTAAALVVAAPALWWQAAHGWPQLTVAGGISADDGAENRILFVPQQLIYLSPLFVPVWVAGWLRLWRDPALRFARPFALAYPLLCLLVLALGGKGYYAVPLLIVLLAAGCAPALEQLRRAGASRLRAVGAAAAVAVTVVINAAVTLPVLPPSALDVPMALNKEQGEQLGWPELADAAARGWSGIPEGRRAGAVLFTQNYGEAGALDRYGPALGLPRPHSGHMAYADWGPPPDTADGPVLLVRQQDADGIERYFTGCRPVARVDNGHGVRNEEQGAAVVLCSGTVLPWSRLWPSLRHYY
ncbi:ArnT family glycosyltransferase [Streptomyces fructofermentans]|uniref:ArnT family glycosyltransferase n=1 Tax=Streptomyces fructofermentans TaxID=152141 RepID=UPI0033EC8466